MQKLEARFKGELFRNLTPNYQIDIVASLDAQKLKAEGVTAIAFDADSTLVEHQQMVIRPETIHFLKELNTPLYIATNRQEPEGDELAELVGAKGIVHASKNSRKPNHSYFQKLEKVTGVPSAKTALVGDRLLTDIYGGNRSGLATVHVKGLGRDPWYMKWTGLRRFEYLLVRVLTVRVQ